MYVVSFTTSAFISGDELPFELPPLEDAENNADHNGRGGNEGILKREQLADIFMEQQ